MVLSISLQHGLHDPFDRYGVGFRRGPAVIKFRRSVEFPAVAMAHLDANRSPFRGDADMFALEADAAFLVDSQAERAGFAQEQFFQAVD